ncbi:hypothetical protein ABID59_005768 [Bradyrhizobium sp. S3.3.6]
MATFPRGLTAIALSAVYPWAWARLLAPAHQSRTSMFFPLPPREGMAA